MPFRIILKSTVLKIPLQKLILCSNLKVLNEVLYHKKNSILINNYKDEKEWLKQIYEISKNIKKYDKIRKDYELSKNKEKSIRYLILFR